MTLGNIISRINKKLVESYTQDSIKKEMKTFSKLVLENKSFSKIYSIYSDLSQNLGLSKEDSIEYVNEGVRIINSHKNNNFTEIDKWIKNVVCENDYSDIDNLVYSADLKKVVDSKKKLSESLQKQKTIFEGVRLPLSTMVQVANKQIESFVETLSESERKEFVELLSKDETSLNEEFNGLKEKTIEKLQEMKNTVEDSEVKNKIQETINKVEKEVSGRIEFVKMKQLLESL